jgi:hypothetical protein
VLLWDDQPVQLPHVARCHHLVEHVLPPLISTAYNLRTF